MDFQLENLALRHQIGVLQRSVKKRPKLTSTDRILGYNGSDHGVRGSLVAYEADSGKEAWRFWTVPGDPAKRFESKALEMAAKTWARKGLVASGWRRCLERYHL